MAFKTYARLLEFFFPGFEVLAFTCEVHLSHPYIKFFGSQFLLSISLLFLETPLRFVANPRNMAVAFVKALNAKIRANPTLSYFCSTRTSDTSFYSAIYSAIYSVRRATKLKRKNTSIYSALLILRHATNFFKRRTIWKFVFLI